MGQTAHEVGGGGQLGESMASCPLSLSFTHQVGLPGTDPLHLMSMWMSLRHLHPGQHLTAEAKCSAEDAVVS